MQKACPFDEMSGPAPYIINSSPVVGIEVDTLDVDTVVGAFVVSWVGAGLQKVKKCCISQIGKHLENNAQTWENVFKDTCYAWGKYSTSGYFGR